MADARADIIIDVDTSVGIAEIKNLQKQISKLNAQLLQSGAQQAKAAQNVQRNLINNINATGDFSARVKTITSTTESFTRSLEANKLSMGQYFRFAGASTQTFGKLFKTEFDTIEKVAGSRVKTLQTQYIKLGRDANGALKAIAVRPLALDMENLATKTAIAAQRQQLFNQLVKQGSTNLLNFGKNTQWAGRQLMVGFTIPLAMMGAAAAKTFMQMEEQAIKFRRVYGDTFTASADTEKMIKQVQQLANEFTRYGVAVEKTMEMAASAAAMGLMNADLLAQVNQATRLSVLGGVEQEQALDTTISLMNAFGSSARDLAKDIDFLNAVENQTVVAIEDMTIAIPKAAPVIKQLGGDMKDLAFFMTAMKEGGINASEGANALKSGLASMINPAQKTSEFLADLGINIKGIVDANAGDVKGTVIAMAQALDTLDPLNRARAIEQLFGKFQFARISTLFQNVVKEGTQAQRVLQISKQTTEELAILSERELKRVEDSPMYKFQKAVEDIKVSLVPLGEAFIRAITPVVEFAKGFLDRFNEMGEGARNFAVIATTVVAGIGPVLLMTFGLIANGVANLIKMFSVIGNIMRGASGSSTDLAQSTEYMTQQQLEAAAVAGSLDQAHSRLIQTFTAESASVDKLATSYARAVVAQSRLLGVNPETGMPIASKRGVKVPRPKRYADGVLSVPGPKGAGDIVPALLSPGEAVIPAKQSQKYAGLIQEMIDDKIPGYRIGRNPFASLLRNSRVSTRVPNATVQGMLKSKDFQYRSAFETKTGRDFTKLGGTAPNSYGQDQRINMERDMMGIPRGAPVSQRPTYGSVESTPFGSMLSRLFGLQGKQFRGITKPGNKHLDLYGSVDLVGKRRLNKKARVFAGDALKQYGYSDMHYKMRRGRGEEGNFLPPMLGSSRTDLENAGRFSQFNHPFGKNIKTGANSFTSNPGSPYIEAQVPGGFSLKDIAKIRVPSRAEAKELQQLVDRAGLKIRVTPRNAPMAIKALANIFGTRFENGVQLNPSTTGLIAAHGADFKTLSDDEAKVFAQQNLKPGSRAYKNFLNPTGRGRNLHSNLVFGMPGSFNTGDMTGNDAARWVRGNRAAFYGYLSDMQGLDPHSPAAKKYANSIAASLSRFGDTKIDDSKFYNLVTKAGASVKDKVFAEALSRAGSTYATGEVFSESSGKSRREALAGAGKSYTKRRAVVKGLHNSQALEFEGVSSPAPKPAVPTSKKPSRPRIAKPAGRPTQASASLGKILGVGRMAGVLGMAGMAASMLGSFQQNQFANGVVSVPGPKGAGDIIPAMLSPGEAVIPAMQSKKYSSLIGAMITDSVPGYNDGLMPPPPPPGAGVRQSQQPIVPQTGADQTRFGTAIGTAMGKTREISRGLASGAAKALKNTVVGSMEENRGLLGRIGRRAAIGLGNVAGHDVVDAKGNVINSGANASKGLLGVQPAQKPGSIVETNGRFFQVDEGGKKVRVSNAAAQEEIQKQSKAPRRGPRMGAGVGMGISMAGSMAGMAMMGSPDPGMQQAGGAVMAGSMVASLLPMLKNPIIALGAVIAVTAASVVFLNEQFKKNAKKAYELEMATGASSQNLQKLSEFAGKVTAGEVMDKRRAQGPDVFQTAAGKTGFGDTFLQSETGKEMFASFSASYSSGGREQAASDLTNQMTAAVASGALSAGQARDIVAAIGKEMNDFPFSISVNSKLLDMLGPNGENLLKDPLAVRVQVVESSRAEVTKFGKVFSEEINLGMASGFAQGDFVGIAAASGAAIGGLIGTAILPGIGTAIGAGVGALVGGGAAFLGTQEGFADQAEAVGGFVANSVIALQNQQEMVDSLQVEYEQRIANAKAQGDLTEAAKLEKEFADSRNKLMLENAETVKAIQTTLMNAPDKLAVFEQYQSLTKDMLKDDPLQLKVLESLEGQISGLTDDREVVVRASLLSGDLNPTTLQNMLASEVSSKQIDLLVNIGAAGLTQANQIAALFGDETVGVAVGPDDARTGSKTQVAASSQFLTSLSSMSPADAMAEMEKFSPVIQAFTVLGDKGLALGMSFFLENPEALTEANTEIALFEEKAKDGVTMQIIQEVFGQEMVNQIATNQAYFDSLPDDQKIIYTTVLRMLGELDPEALRIQAINAAVADDTNFKKESKGRTYSEAVSQFGKAVADSMATDSFVTSTAVKTTEAANTKPNTTPTPTPTTKSGGDKKDPYEDVLKRLKEIRNAAINASGGLKEFNKVLAEGSATTTKFVGTDQKLLFAGYSQEFISAINSMDEETRKKFVSIKNGVVTVTKQGKLLNKAYSEIKLGDFQFSLVSGVAAINKQQQAMVKLTAAGLGASDAFEISQDETLAYAIATATTTEEVESLVRSFEKLKKKQQEQQIDGFSVQLGFSVEEINAQMLSMTRLTAAGMGAGEALEVVQDKSLALAIAAAASAEQVEEIIAKFEALKKKEKEFKVQEFTIGLGTQATEISSQMSSFQKLTTAGLGAADAFEIIQDRQVAMAISSASTTEQIKKIIEEFNNLKKKQNEFALEEFVVGLLTGTSAISNQFTAMNKLTAAGMSAADALDVVQNEQLALAIAAGASAEKIKQLVDGFAALQRKQQEFKFNEFKISLGTNAKTITMQLQAMAKLTAAGISAADAFEIVQDEALAYAIAAGTTSKAVRELTGDFVKLKKRQQELAFATPEGTLSWLDDYIGALTSATSRVSQFFDAQRAIVEEDFDRGTNRSRRNADLLNTSTISKTIDAAQEQIAEYQFSIDDLQYDLSSIEDKENDVNKKYDERLEALHKIYEANSDIADQQAMQLDIAEALASGDIGAAARAMREQQARRAEKAKADQEAAIQRARELEINTLRSTGNKTRKELESEILKITKEIEVVEQSRLQPAERALRLAENLRDIALEAIGEEGYLGQTEEGWRSIENAARLAVVQSEAFRESIKNILREIPGFNIDASGNVGFNEAGFAASIPAPNPPEPTTEPKATAPVATAPVATTPAATAPAATAPVATAPVVVPEVVPEVVVAKKLNTIDSSFAVVANAKNNLLELAAPLQANAEVFNRDDAKKAAIAAEHKGGFKAGGITIKSESVQDFATQLMDKILENRALVRSGTLSEARKDKLTEQNIDLMKKSGIRFNTGGMVPQGLSMGKFGMGTDTLPAMLSSGEFVMSRYAVSKYGVEKMKAINSGSYKNDSVYNYNLSVNVKSDANPDQIAKVVMGQIRQIDSQRIRSNRN